MESSPEQTAEGIALVQVLASVLDRLVSANAALALTDPGQITKFHALKAPGIGIQQYLERIYKYASCSNECFVLGLIYIDRLIQRNNFLLTELNVHRVVITAILLAAKFFDDAYYNNAYYAKVGGVLVSEMNGLEVDFLFRINFSLHVTPELFNKYKEELLSHHSTTLTTMVSPMTELQQPISNHTATPIAIPVATRPAVTPPLTDQSIQSQHKSHFSTSNHSANGSYITPSPPSTANNPDGAEIIASLHVTPQGMAATVPMSTEPIHTYLQRANSVPLESTTFSGAQYRRCSPQTVYNGIPLPTTSDFQAAMLVNSHIINSSQHHLVYENPAVAVATHYPFGAMLHQHQDKQPDLIHHQRNHTDPRFRAVDASIAAQYFVSGGTHIMTGAGT